MNDERYVFISDVKERKSVARSARSRRTHNGKGGRVIMPSDHMTRKEWEAMNGDVKSYKLNEPMSYAEFKALPDDIKKIYIKTLRSKFNVPDKHIAQMMDVKPSALGYTLGKLGVSNGNKNSKMVWDRDGWSEWVEGRAYLPEEVVEEVLADDACESAEVVEEFVEKFVDEVVEDTREKAKIAPRSGTLQFEGSATEVFAAAAALLGDSSFVIHITWTEY